MYNPLYANKMNVQHNSKKGCLMSDYKRLVQNGKDVTALAKKPTAIIVVIVLGAANAVMIVVNTIFPGDILSRPTVYVIVGSCVALTLLISVPFYCIYMIKRLRNYIIDKNIVEQINKTHDENTKTMDKLSDLTAQLHSCIKSSEKLSEHIDICPRIVEHNIVEKSYIIQNVSDYYKLLKEARQRAVSGTVRLMDFSTMPHNHDLHEKNNERSDYYLNEVEFWKSHKDVQIYRIVTIHSVKKLINTRTLIENLEKSKLDNFHLACLDIDNFSNSRLHEVVGMQLINDEVILMDFRYARANSTNGFNKPLYIKSKETSDFFSNYYKFLWNEIANNNRGWILYNGETGVHSDFDYIFKSIEYKLTT